MRVKQLKSGHAFVVDPVTNSSVSHPTAIVKVFQKYYYALYNLKDYPATLKVQKPLFQHSLIAYSFQ